MKAADIKDWEILLLVEQGATTRDEVVAQVNEEREKTGKPAYPSKVVKAKIVQMVNKGRLLSPCVFTGSLRMPPKQEVAS